MLDKKLEKEILELDDVADQMLAPLRTACPGNPERAAKALALVVAKFCNVSHTNPLVRLKQVTEQARLCIPLMDTGRAGH